MSAGNLLFDYVVRSAIAYVLKDVFDWCKRKYSERKLEERECTAGKITKTTEKS